MNWKVEVGADELCARQVIKAEHGIDYVQFLHGASLILDGWHLVYDIHGGSGVLSIQKTSTITKRALQKTFFVVKPGTLYLYEKKKKLSADFVAGDYSAQIQREFGIDEIRFATPKRRYAACLADNKGDIEKALSWVHSSGPVVREGYAGKDKEFPHGLSDLAEVHGGICDFRIDKDVQWAIADYVAGCGTGYTYPYAILYTEERRYDILAQSLRWYLQEHPQMAEYGFSAEAAIAFGADEPVAVDR